MKPYVTPTQREALFRFKQAHLPNWKAALRQCWESGNYAGTIPTDMLALQQLRNSTAFGPKGLLHL